jgi:hypothetical protein
VRFSFEICCTFLYQVMSLYLLAEGVIIVAYDLVPTLFFNH